MRPSRRREGNKVFRPGHGHLDEFGGGDWCDLVLKGADHGTDLRPMQPHVGEGSVAECLSGKLTVF